MFKRKKSKVMDAKFEKQLPQSETILTEIAKSDFSEDETADSETIVINLPEEPEDVEDSEASEEEMTENEPSEETACENEDATGTDSEGDSESDPEEDVTDANSESDPEEEEETEEQRALIEAFATGAGIAVEDVERAMQKIEEISVIASAKEFSADLVKFMLNGINYERDLRRARMEGLIAGRNEQIVAAFRDLRAEKEKEIPSFNGSAGIGTETRKRSIFDVARNVR